MAATYNNLYLDARKRLREAGVEGAQLEARELVCCAAGKSREQFYRDMALYASDPVEEKLAELLGRRAGGGGGTAGGWPGSRWPTSSGSGSSMAWAWISPPTC